MNTPVRTAIVDDHPLFRQALREVIAVVERFKVVGEAGDAASCMKLLTEERPDLMLLDISLPGMSGLDIARRLQSARSKVKVIVLTMHKEEDLFNKALNLDVKGYLLKENAVSEIVDCLTTVASGDYYLTASMSACLMRRRARALSLDSTQPGLSRLTTAERRILRLIGDNRTSKEIARHIGISYRTVETHRTNICSKLNLHGCHRLLRFALEHQSEL